MGVQWGGDSPGVHRAACRRCAARMVELGYRAHALCLLRKIVLAVTGSLLLGPSGRPRGLPT